MPVAIGNELKLQNNKVNAEYGELFRKLNVAKAWTNTTTTESGGTVTVLNGDGNVITNIQCGYNDWYINGVYDYPPYLIIVGGKLYTYDSGSLNQVGDKTNWKSCTGYQETSGYVHDMCAVDSDGKLYAFQKINKDGTYENMVEIGSGTNWTYICGIHNYSIAIGDGKLYKIYVSFSGSTVQPTITQIGTDEGWTKITMLNNTTYRVYGLCNGYVYSINYNNASLSLMHSNNDFIDISGDGNSSGGPLVALNSSGEIFYNYPLEDTLVKINFPHGAIKYISSPNSNSGGRCCAITSDNKLYIVDAYSNWFYEVEISSEKNWSYTIIGEYQNGIASIVGVSEGKLYLMKGISTYNGSGGTITQIGTATGYKKVEGECNSSRTEGSLYLAWTGSATHTETTVYTTSNPIANDKVYSDTNLTEYSTVQSCTGSTMTDNYRTYQADTSKNSSFTKIPPASIHETIKAIDILRATE